LTLVANVIKLFYLLKMLQAKVSLNNLVQSLQVRPEPTRVCSTLAGSVTKEKGVLKLTPGVNVIKLFSSLLTMRPNKLERLYLAITFQSNLTFAGSTKSFPKKEASERSSNWVGSGLALKF
jgi:hypothetical protein